MTGRAGRRPPARPVGHLVLELVIEFDRERNQRLGEQRRHGQTGSHRLIITRAPLAFAYDRVHVASWREIEESAPEFAAHVRRHLDERVHKTIATLRADGSPRISGIETFHAEGHLWFGSMPNARKALDLRRDPRFSLHSGSVDPPGWEGDAKLTGRADELADAERRLALFRSRRSEPPSTDSHLFRADIYEAVLVRLSDARDRLVIELWRPGRHLERFER